MITDNVEKELFCVRVEPEDWVRQFNKSWEGVDQMIIDAFPKKYRDKVLGLKKDKYGDYAPVFDEKTQKEWDKELHDYITAKAEWCQKYGSN